jgi:hypothetical protein
MLIKQACPRLCSQGSLHHLSNATATDLTHSLSVRTKPPDNTRSCYHSSFGISNTTNLKLTASSLSERDDWRRRSLRDLWSDHWIDRGGLRQAVRKFFLLLETGIQHPEIALRLVQSPAMADL